MKVNKPLALVAGAFRFLRSVKLTLISLLLVIIYLGGASLASRGLSGGRDALFSPLFLIPLGIFLINLLSCTVYRIMLEVTRRRLISPGPDLIHLALVAAAVAALVSLFGRWDGEVVLSPGEGVRLDENFLLLLEDFQISRYDNGGIREWTSLILVVDQQGEPVKRMEVRVNHPGRIGAYRIYQSSWSEGAGELFSGLMAVRDPSVPFAAVSAVLMISGLMLTYLTKRRGN